MEATARYCDSQDNGRNLIEYPMKNRIEIRGNVLDALLTADPEVQAEARALIAEINSIPAVNRKDMYE